LAFRFGAPDVYLLKRNTTEMITDELKALVKDEAEKLKKYATPKERGCLSFEKLSGLNASHCIYGQMTGDCFSERATELLNKCAKPYSSQLFGYARTSSSTFIQNRAFFSPIEVYINLIGAKRNYLIDFLKGKSKTLNL